MIKVNLENLDETARAEMLKLAKESLDSGNSQFAHSALQYTATITDEGVMEIYERPSPKSVMSKWTAAESKELRDKVKVGKESANPDDRKFTVGGIYYEIKEPTTGSFVIHTSLV